MLRPGNHDSQRIESFQVAGVYHVLAAIELISGRRRKDDE